MKRGTKSLLFGVHQFLWHPFTVYLAWIWLYRKLPTFKETVCILIHDWGYWGCPNMDGEEGERHPELGAKIAHFLLDRTFFDAYFSEPAVTVRFETTWQNFCLYHSRHYARNAGVTPSMLCWADKLSILFEPWWLYLPRAWASGELAEYRQLAANVGAIPLNASHREWHKWIRDRLMKLGQEKRGDAVAYVSPERSSR